MTNIAPFNQLPITEDFEASGLEVVKYTNSINSPYFMGSVSKSIDFQQEKSDKKLFLINRRFAFLPKGTSPIIDNMAEINEEMCEQNIQHNISMNCNSSIKFGIDRSFKDLQILTKQNLHTYETKVHKANNYELLTHRSYRLLQRISFNSSLFEKIQVLGQLDNKFIVCLLYNKSTVAADTKVLALFDQHAVHERIRVEKLIDDYTDKTNKILLSCELRTSLEVELIEQHLMVLENFSENFKKLGFHWNLNIDKKVAGFNRVPLCLYRTIRNKSTNAFISIVKSVLWDQYHAIFKTGAIHCGISKPLIDIINTEACRGAIKFNEAISMEKCMELISDLAGRRSPFICAHGRSNMATLACVDRCPLNLISKPKLQRLKQLEMKLQE
ncbi:DNA mismatch repair protein Mlh3-like [Ctenocephalides felis]|uniref:DNA mismatch repair protein Mlh3-like n=1 Tax=Ctenocephalides felis TaxID=7515 RepID=UPI000E6E3703|nr:DNA mismatch repair protein Mlh3-like [Ctenocephalides felis]